MMPSSQVGKAPDSGSGSRRFESYLGSHNGVEYPPHYFFMTILLKILNVLNIIYKNALGGLIWINFLLKMWELLLWKKIIL